MYNFVNVANGLMHAKFYIDDEEFKIMTLNYRFLQCTTAFLEDHLKLLWVCVMYARKRIEVTELTKLL